MPAMVWIVALAVAVFAVAAATALVRGLMAFHSDAEALRSGSNDADLQRGKQQNRMMSQRVLFQGLAILAIALLGGLAAST